jgi:hypothetical protein
MRDKGLLNQGKALDAINNFKSVEKFWTFVRSVYIKQKNNEKNYQLVS